MAKNIQIRDVRPELHAELVRRAKLRGVSLSSYLEELLEREVAHADHGEWFARIRSRRDHRGGPAMPPDEIVRAIRETRGPLPDTR